MEKVSFGPQEDFLEVMQTYPESSKAMDLVAEHRLRSLHRSQAWQARQRQPDDSPHLGGILAQILQVRLAVFKENQFYCEMLRRELRAEVV